MSKFKVGDKVRIKFGDGYILWVSEMRRFIGKTVTISETSNSTSHPWFKIMGHFYHWNECDAEPIEQPRREFIVLRRSGAETIAELRHDREVIKSAKATCAPSDTFDFDTGAKLAFDRLMGRQNIDEAIKAWSEPSPAPEPPEFYTGRVKLAKSCGCYECEHIVGEEFAISNGYVISDRGAWGQPFASFSDFVAKRHNKNWIEVKSNV